MYIFGSKRRNVKFGVPQGSLLDPLLFIVFVSDLDPEQKDTKTILYAKDTANLTTTPGNLVQQERQKALDETSK